MSVTPEQRAEIRKLREGKGWTQKHLAGRAKTTNGTISNIESGETKQPKAIVFMRIMRALTTDAELATPIEGLDEFVLDVSKLDGTDLDAVRTLARTLANRPKKTP